MYINRLIYENVGPIQRININMPFNEDGTPKPVILVGENGSGKSTVLSNIVDSFFEFADLAYSNVKETDFSTNKLYYKTLSNIEINGKNNYMFTYISYNNDTTTCYISKSGKITVEEIAKKYNIRIPSEMKRDEESYKSITRLNNKKIDEIWSSNVICYFAPNRYEKPLWMGDNYYEIDNFSHPQISERIIRRLNNPIYVNNVNHINLQWILDVISDSRLDFEMNNGNVIVDASNTDRNILSIAKHNLEIIMSTILGEDVWFYMDFRDRGASRLKILNKSKTEIVCPTLDSLSTGQSALFNLFSTILRYADNNKMVMSTFLNDISGIVVIDEIELHLHSKLQKEILPQLLKLFPRIQFIITTHSPLFLLGMEEIYGNENYEIYEMPSATKISVERFSEFQKAYNYFKETKTYQEENDQIIKEAIEKATTTDKPIIITEGSTDWKHLKAAHNALKNDSRFSDVFQNLEFEFLKYEPANSKSDAKVKLKMGDKTLIKICENNAKVPNTTKKIFIADRDVPDTNTQMGGNEKSYKNWGNNVYSLILPVPPHRIATPNICIEHFYTDDEIKTEYQYDDGISRRLYIGNEFNSNGISVEKQKMCYKRSFCGKDSIKIIEGTEDERVTDLNDTGTNYAMPKSKFAELVLSKEPPFDNFNFDSFVEIFRIIKQIINEE